MKTNKFWQQWLFIAAILLAIQGMSWIVLGSFEPFGIYDSIVAKTFAEQESIPASAVPFYRFLVGILGATDAAFFVLFAFIVKYPFAAGERWAHVALTVGLLTWFVLDSGFCACIGAWFNIAIVNVPCLIVLGIPLLVTAKPFYRAAEDAGSKTIHSGS